MHICHIDEMKVKNLNFVLNHKKVDGKIWQKAPTILKFDIVQLNIKFL